jgi:hypothetical protein
MEWLVPDAREHARLFLFVPLTYIVHLRQRLGVPTHILGGRVEMTGMVVWSEVFLLAWEVISVALAVASVLARLILIVIQLHRQLPLIRQLLSVVAA